MFKIQTMKSYFEQDFIFSECNLENTEQTMASSDSAVADIYFNIFQHFKIFTKKLNFFIIRKTIQNEIF